MDETSETRREPFLARVGRTCHDRRWRVLLAWVVILLTVGIVAGAKGAGYSTKFSLPDVESAKGFNLLERDFGGQGAGINGTIVFRADQGVNDPSVRQPMDKLFTELQHLPGLPEIRVISPYAPGQEQHIAAQGPQAGKIAYAELELPKDADIQTATKVRKAIDERIPKVDGLRVEIGGQVFAEFEPPNSEAIGLGFAVVILIISFGSVMAMGLPIGTALTGIFIGVGAAGILSHIVEMPEFTSFIAVMIGLGVGIDYALFIVTRYREELHAGHAEADATAIAINTAGRAVLFAGTTVVISLLGMLIMGLAFVNGLAIGSALVVFVTMVASVTLLPALLGFVGNKVEVTRWRGLVAALLVAVGLIGAGLKFQPLMGISFVLALMVLVAGIFVRPLKREVPHRTPPPVEKTFAYRWSRVIQHHAWFAVIGGVLLLGILAVPVFGLRLGFSDEGNYPESSTTRRAYDLLAEGFGPGFNGPLLLVAELPAGTDPAALAKVAPAVMADPGVAFASPATPSPQQPPKAVQWFVIPKTAPQAQETADLVSRLRSDVLPAATAGTNANVFVTGSVAVNTDFSDYLGKRLVWFLAAVLSLSFLLLMAVFRSILVPLKAVLMNLLALGAAYGVIVAIFQRGFLSSALGVHSTGPVEPFIPMMLFAIVFGLSMDYEVFLLSRVKEEYDSGKPNDRAVADGLASTARVITAAAAIMVVVFGSFLLETDRVVKLMGFGLAIAVLLDATVVRMLLVPATMELLGDKNWWIPRWLDRILPKLDVEGGHRDQVLQAPESPPVEESVDAEHEGGRVEVLSRD